jgi:hypothetical protein
MTESVCSQRELTVRTVQVQHAQLLAAHYKHGVPLAALAQVSYMSAKESSMQDLFGSLQSTDIL